VVKQRDSTHFTLNMSWHQKSLGSDLYLDTMESVMANSTKVMVDVEGGNNLLYLPLDKLINQTQNNSNSGYSTSVVPNTQSTNDNNRRSANRRDR
jgi:membrane protease subunit HflK